MKQCTSCGAKIKDEANFCSSCGSDTFIVKGAVKGKKNKWFIGVAVCVVLGIIGVIASGGSSSPSTATTASKFTFDYSVSSVSSTAVATEEYTDAYTYSQYVPTTTQSTYSSNLYTTSASTTSFAVREIPLTSDLQYTLNLFLSNFSEANMKSFTRFPNSEDAAKFALNFNFINKRENFEMLNNPVTLNGVEYNYRIPKEIIRSTVFNYFFITQLLPSFDEKIPFYYDGYYYYQFTGGMIMDDLTVVTRVVQTDRYEYEVYFKLYDVASNNANMYTMSDYQVQAEMQNKSFIRYSGNGMAVIDTSDIYSHNECRLADYYIY